jgi:3-phenylpropionate/trans-cinnamate dioxygenase ferredoxin component
MRVAEFISVGSVDDVPEGEMRGFQVGGEDVAVANVGGTLHAFNNICTHMQCLLTEGDLDDTIVTCACHGSQFDVTTGDVMNGPATEPVDTYEVATDEGDLKIGV